jgi:hypothetical protein
LNKRLTVLLVCMAVISLAMVPGAGMAKQNGGKWVTSESWTIALYISGDNNLERYWDDASLPGILLLPANEMLTIVAYIDRLSVSGTEVVEISGADCESAATYGEKDFGSPETFQWFLDDVEANYMSDKLAVVAWDHGYAWRYISDDDTSGDSRIEMPELQAAIEGAGVYIDVLAFDACNMASIEVAYQLGLTGLVGYMVGSEESVPTTGFPYDLMLGPTAADTSRSPADMATDMVVGFQAFYEPQTWASTVALSAVDIPALMDGADEIGAWTAAMHAGLPLYVDSYKLDLKASYFAWCTHYHVDIADLGDTLLADATIDDEALKTATANMVAAVDGSVIASWGGRAAEDARGLTLWWGYGGDWKFYSEAYLEVAFAIDMGWWDLLDDYN